MKIAMIGHKDFPSRSGGVEVVVYELSTRLAARGHEVTVYNRGRRDIMFIRNETSGSSGFLHLKSRF